MITVPFEKINPLGYLSREQVMDLFDRIESGEEVDPETESLAKKIGFLINTFVVSPERSVRFVENKGSYDPLFEDRELLSACAFLGRDEVRGEIVLPSNPTYRRNQNGNKPTIDHDH